MRPSARNRRGNRGFTLVELLIVVGIIGILVSVVTASLNVARSKGADAKTKTQMASLKQAAELYYSTNNSYGIGPSSSCSAGMFADTVSGIREYTNCANYPGGCASTIIKCNSDGSQYAVSVNLNGGEYWCIDSTGFSDQVPADPGQVVVCPLP